MSAEDMKPQANQYNRWANLRMVTRNPISLLGLAVTVVALANILFLFIIDVISTKSGPYVGILGIWSMPAFLIAGLFLVAFGFWRERKKKIVESANTPKYPRIDLNDPHQRGLIAFFGTFMMVFVLMSAVGSYKAYEFTDSVKFCGQLCHSVMNPEFTAYRDSPHAPGRLR